MSCRTYTVPTDLEYARASTTATIEVETNVITLVYDAEYIANFGKTESGYSFTITVREDDENGKIIHQEDLEGIPGTVWENTVTFENTQVGGVGDIWLGIELTSFGLPQAKGSNPNVRVNAIALFAKVEKEIAEFDVDTEYLAEDLPDLQFVQSPYGFDIDPLERGYKELVIVHPRHMPSRLFFNGTTYVLEPFDYGDNEPNQWVQNNYPKAVTSFMGRLVYGGSEDQTAPLGDPLTSATETIWATEVGRWGTFSDPNDPEAINPDDSIEITTTYRSPIQWLYGHKTLLTGALEYEYVVSADGIFSPGDLGVDVHSTHGSRSVQPVGMGQGVLFAADNGRKCRAMTYSNDDGGWVAAEMSLLVPELMAGGIRRMVRMRNPHQMAVCLAR